MKTCGFGALCIEPLERRVTKYANKPDNYNYSRNEHHILSLLSPHDHIIKLCQYFEDPARGPVLVFEYGGTDLFDVQPLVGCNDTICQYILKQVRSALRFLHEHRVAHLDVKLENIVVDALTNVRLIDFGMATTSPCVHRICGTNPYVCPEMWRKWNETNVYTADIWSYGIVAFALYHGFLAWEVANAGDARFSRVLEKQAQGALPYASVESSRASPPWLQQEMNTTLWVDPRKRRFSDTPLTYSQVVVQASSLVVEKGIQFLDTVYRKKGFECSHV